MLVVHRNKVTSSPLRIFASVFVAMLGLCHCSNHNGTFLGTPELSGPSVALEKTVAVFECKLQPHPGNETVLMTLFNRGSNDSWLGDSTSLAGEAATFNLIVDQSHAGALVCEARAQNNSNIKPTVSNTHYLNVFEPVSIVTIYGETVFLEGEELGLFCFADGTNVSFKWLLNDQPISSPHVLSHDFHLWMDRATPADSGYYVCEASNSFNSTDFTARSRKVHVTVTELFEGEDLELICPTVGNSFNWLLNDQPISLPHVFFSDHFLWINSITPEDSGTYKCVAASNFNGTESIYRNWQINITVKALVSDPDISFAVLKDDSHDFSVGVTCQSAVGTPPVDFSLYNGTQWLTNVTSADRRAVFRVPGAFGKHLGKFRCQANNGAKTVSSEWLPIKIEKIKGPVSLTYDYDVAENFAVIGVRLYCKVAAGSHLQYQWFLNKSLLQDHGSFYYVFNHLPEQSILILSVGRSSAGTYHCVVSNSFDNTTMISSRGRYLDKEVLNRLPVLVVAVVFGFFIFLILLVVICCGFGVIYGRREYGDTFLLEMERRVVAYEGELDVSEYSDGADALKTVEGDWFDRASDASSDEWPQIALQKRTIEDEPIEVP